MSAPEAKAVFLSYASQDAEAAKRICESLRQAGVEVWFDQSELRGGDAWDQSIRKQIKECALFVPVISANTQERQEGYFRLEWRLADQRTHLMSHDRAFIVPVVIDDTRDAGARVPESFLAVQWTRLPNGETPAAFIARLNSLLERGTDAPAVSSAPVQKSVAAETRRPTSSAARRWWWLVAAAALLGGSLFFAWRRHAEAKLPMPAMEQSTRRSSRPDVAALLARARAVMDKVDVVRGDFDTAETLLDQAAKLEPTDANVWAAWALLDRRYVDEWYDRSPARYDAAQRHARQAIGIDPASPMARFAQASSLVLLDRNAATKADAIGILESALPDLGREPRAFFLLASLKFDPARPEATFGYLDRAARVPGWAGRAEFERSFAYFRAAEWERCLAAIDRSVTIERSARSLLWNAYILTIWRGDTTTAKRLVAEVPPAVLTEDFPAAARYFDALWARDYEAAYDAMRVVPRDYINSVPFSGPTGYFKGYALARAGKTAAAAIEWRSALDVIDRRLTAQPSDRTALEFKALLLAALGDTAGAQDLWHSQRELFGDTMDSFSDFIAAMQLLSEDDAIEQLARLMNKGSPGGLAANLRLCPFLDRLRGNPRFSALLAQAEADPRLSPTAKPAHGDANKPSASAAGKFGPSDKSIAVLAFRQLGADPQNEYLCEAISDELCNSLGRTPGLRVAASASAFAFKGKHVPPAEIGTQLGVAYLVDGTVQKLGDRVRVRAQLIKAADGFTLWSSDTLEHEAKDMFAVQDAVVAAIAKSLQVQLGAAVAPREINPEAYRLYYEGRRAWTLRASKGQLQRALDDFQKAVDLDPMLGRAYAGLADATLEQSVGVEQAGGKNTAMYGQRTSDEMRAILALAEKAVQLEPESAETHSARARVLFYAWQFVDAEHEARRALELNPSFADAHTVLARLLDNDGRLDEAIKEIDTAMRLDPLTSRNFDNAAALSMNAGRYSEALQEADHALMLQPDSFQALSIKSQALSAVGRHDEAVVIARRPEVAGFAPTVAVLCAAGLKDEAETVSKSMRGSSHAKALALVALGRTDDVFKVLRPDEASALGFMYLFYRPEFDPVRRDPRFVRYLERLGLTEAHARAQAWRRAHSPEKSAAMP